MAWSFLLQSKPLVLLRRIRGKQMLALELESCPHPPNASDNWQSPGILQEHLFQRSLSLTVSSNAVGIFRKRVPSRYLPVPLDVKGLNHQRQLSFKVDKEVWACFQLYEQWPSCLMRGSGKLCLVSCWFVPTHESLLKDARFYFRLLWRFDVLGWDEDII